jgi:hypothetical protein
MQPIFSTIYVYFYLLLAINSAYTFWKLHANSTDPKRDVKRFSCAVIFVLSTLMIPLQLYQVIFLALETPTYTAHEVSNILFLVIINSMVVLLRHS